MSRRPYIPTTIRDAVIQRAGNRCEYCLLPAEWASIAHHVDHVIPLKHNGSTVLVNLAYACFACNIAKGSDIAAFDPLNDEIVRLFHPRQDVWSEHFWLGDGHLVGKTAIGRCTAELLQFNVPSRIRQRMLLIAANTYRV